MVRVRLLLLLSLSTASAFAEQSDRKGVFLPAADERRSLDISRFDYQISDGLYATVTSMQSFKKPDIQGERKLKLTVEGFRKEVEVRALLQQNPAPLVVIFLGLASGSKDPVARLWQKQSFEAGNHVIVFDSVFRSSFNERSRHGVPGYLEAEAGVAADVIKAFLHHPAAEGKVTKIGILGASYGGMLALTVSRLGASGKISVNPDRVLVFSPPANMQHASLLLDRYYEEDYARHGLLDLLKIRNLKPKYTGAVPYSPSLLRAGIGYVFHEDVESALSISSKFYDLRLDGKSGFTRYVEEVVFPYWKGEGCVTTLDGLWNCGDLGALLTACPDTAHAVMAVDDPLNDPQAAAKLRDHIPAHKLTLLPRGGHLGFVGCTWTRECVQKMFD